MSAFYTNLQNVIDERIIDIRDFPTYHIKTIGPKDPEEVKLLKTACNKEYEKFHKEVLMPRADGGKIKCRLAVNLWMQYEDLKEVMTFVRNDNVPIPNIEAATYWYKEITSKTIDELHRLYGTNVMATGYGTIVEYCKWFIIKAKYDRIYSKTDDTDELVKLIDENYGLYDGSESPFDITSIRQKVLPLIPLRA